MTALLLILTLCASSASTFIKKPYTIKTGGRGVYFFTALSTLAALLFFVCSSGGNLTFKLEVLPYSVGFAATYLIAVVTSMKAISCGPFGLTGLITSFSCVIPAVYGLVFLGDPVSVGWLIGIALMTAALILAHDIKNRNGVSVKWAIYCVLSLVANGGCSTIQKAQQVASNGAYKSELMIMALAIVCVATTAIALVQERSQLKTYAKYGWYEAPLCGIANGVVNLLAMLLSARMPSALLFPLISVSGLVVTLLVGMILYHEKHSRKELLGFAAGIASVVFLNL